MQEPLGEAASPGVDARCLFFPVALAPPDAKNTSDARPPRYELVRASSSGSSFVAPGFEPGAPEDKGAAVYEMLRATTATSDPRSPLSDAGIGYSSRLPRQA